MLAAKACRKGNELASYFSKNVSDFLSTLLNVGDVIFNKETVFRFAFGDCDSIIWFRNNREM